MIVRNGKPTAESEAEIQARADQKWRDHEATQRAPFEAEARKEVEGEQRHVAAQRLCVELDSLRPAIVQRVDERRTDVEEARAKYQAAIDAHATECLALSAHDGRRAAAEQEVGRTTPDPFAELKKPASVDTIMRWHARLEYSDDEVAGSGFVFHGRRIGPNMFGLAQALDRAIGRLDRELRNEVLRLIGDDQLRSAAPRSLPR